MFCIALAVRYHDPLVSRGTKSNKIEGNNFEMYVLSPYHSVQNLLSSRLLSKNIKNRLYKIYNFVCGSVWV
jgi:hypothetical protein